jgi:hypothetical protein
VDATREAEELVALWQELQAAQVAGDVRRLEGLRRLAEARAQRPDASGEWRLLAREAGRHTGDLREEVEAAPTVGVGDAAAARVERAEPVDVSLPDAAREPAEEGAPERERGFRLGPLIWIVIIAAWVLLQVLGGTGEGAIP